jgi:hypothetical protein
VSGEVISGNAGSRESSFVPGVLIVYWLVERVIGDLGNLEAGAWIA